MNEDIESLKISLLEARKYVQELEQKNEKLEKKLNAITQIMDRHWYLKKSNQLKITE